MDENLIGYLLNALDEDTARQVEAGLRENPEVQKRLAQLGFRPVANTPDEFGARIKLEIDKWGKVVHDANLKIE